MVILWVLGAAVLLIGVGLVAVYWYLESAKRLIGLDRNPMRFFWKQPVATLRWARLTRRAWRYLSTPIPNDPGSLRLRWPREYLQQSLKHQLLEMGRTGKFTVRFAAVVDLEAGVSHILDILDVAKDALESMERDYVFQRLARQEQAS